MRRRPAPCRRWNFNPRSPHGERRIAAGKCPLPLNFNPRSPHGERQSSAPLATTAARFQSTLPARGATIYMRIFPSALEISIHAPRTGSDDVVVAPRLFLNISIHAPRTGSDLQLPEIPEVEPYFNPRSPHGERQRRPAHRGAVRGFQSTLPARGATRMALPDALPQAISIHAPRTGSDMLGRKKMANVMTHFNPRSPHGERGLKCVPAEVSAPTKRRSPCGERGLKYRADGCQKTTCGVAPRTGSDADVVQSLCVDEGFQSTLPARGATPQVVF